MLTKKSTAILFCRLIILILLGTLISYAKEYKPLRIKLPNDVSNGINVITQDSKGFLWIGTESGLSRFDGYGFLSFHSKKEDPHSLMDNNVLDITPDPRGFLWVKTEKGYGRFDMADEKFYNDVETYFSNYGLEINPISIVWTHDDELWLFDSHNIYVQNLETGQIHKVVFGNRACQPIDITGICYGNKYLAAVTIKNELWLIDRQTKRLYNVVNIPNDTPPQPGTNLAIYSDHDDLLWIWSINNLFLYDVPSERMIDAKNIRVMIPSILEKFCHDTKGHIWVARNHQGITLLDKNHATQGTSLSKDVVGKIENQTISCLFEDSNGTIWIGTHKYGIYRCDEASTRFDLMSINDVNVIANDNNEGVWIGTDANWLYYWDRVMNKLEHVPLYNETCRDRAITCLQPDKNGGVYVGTYQAGLIYTDKNGKGKNYTISDGLLTDNIWALTYDKNGKLWAGTLGYGMQYLDNKQDKWISVGSKDPSQVSNYIMSIAPVDDELMYLGTADGVMIFNPKTGAFLPFQPEIFSKTFVTQVMIDHQNALWITSREGLHYYLPETNTLREINLGLNYDAPFIHGIVEGPDGRIWITISSMIVAIQPDNLSSGRYKVTVYDNEDGLPGSDFSHRSISLLDNRTIGAGGLHGITYFRPSEFEINNKVPHVMFSALYLNGQPISPKQKVDGKIVIEKSLSLAPTVHIPSSDYHFTIHFATENAQLPQKTRYFYRLGKNSKDWIECVPGTNFVSYNRLAPGKYTLFVKSITSDGKESEQSSQINIVVHPPFWATFWAIIIYVLIIIIGLITIFRALRKKEMKRIEEQKQKAEIDKQNQLSEMKLKFFTNISHELRTPLTLILSPLESLKKENLSLAACKKIDTMQRNAQHLLDLVNQILDMRKLEMHGLELKLSNGDVMSFIHVIASNFNVQAINNKIDYLTITNPDSFIMYFDQDKLGKIINNLLSNAFKFTTEGGKINIIANVEADNLEIKVIDTGIGISEEAKKHVFERFYQSEHQNVTGSGIGLNMVWEYAQLHHGNVSVEDNPSGKGCVFTVKIPIENSNISNSPTLQHENKGLDVISKEKPTALIVDDNHDILDLLRDTLEIEYNVICASNGKEALVKLIEYHPDIILTDVMMPQMDGIELCRHIKSDVNTAQIPLIMLTAKSDISSTLLGLTIGADDYLTKPYNPEELQLRMRKLITLSKKGMRRPLIEPKPSDIKILSVDEKLIGKAVTYVESNMDRSELSVEELSQHLGMSRVHLYKRMMQLTGKPPKEFIRSMRLKRAAQLLRESQLNVSEIAYSVGFNLTRLFTKYFKEEYGMLPSEYKDTYGKK